MIEVFADTFFWLALLNTRDTHHDRVLSFQVSGSIVTTWAVQLEVMDAFCERRHRPLAVRFWQETTTDQGLVTIPADWNLLNRAAALFANRHDKDWSMTDCYSFIVMEDRGITDALTGDHHFEQAGFRPLFKQ
jgi:uncharacterized protein